MGGCVDRRGNLKHWFPFQVQLHSAHSWSFIIWGEKEHNDTISNTLNIGKGYWTQTGVWVWVYGTLEKDSLLFEHIVEVLQGSVWLLTINCYCQLGSHKSQERFWLSLLLIQVHKNKLLNACQEDTRDRFYKDTHCFMQHSNKINF